LKNTFEIFTSHALARALGALLILYLYLYDEKLLAVYSVKFSTLHIFALIVKFGFAQKIFRDSASDLKCGAVSLRKYNALFYTFIIPIVLVNIIFPSPIISLTVMMIAFSSVRFAYLMGSGRMKIAIFFEFSLPIFITLILITFRVTNNIEHILFVAYFPSFFTVMFLLWKFDFIRTERINASDIRSGTYFFLSSLTSQLNTHIVILLFNANFTYEYVSNVRLVQVLATPLQLVNVSFATAFQKLANGDYKFVDVNYEKSYLMTGFLVTLIVFISLLISQHFNFYFSINYPLIMQFFIAFVSLYLIRILFRFSDTRVIIAQREDLIFKFNFIITIIILLCGGLLSFAKLPLAAYISFNLAPLLLASCCFIWTEYYDAKS